MKVPGQLSSTISFERINLLLAQFVKGKINTPIIEGWNTIESLLKEKKFVVFLLRILLILLDGDNTVPKEEEKNK